MEGKVHTVAVIGAGISGVCATAHLLKQGLLPTLYERSSVAGGVWHFDKNAAHEPPYPNEVASHGDYKRILFDEHGYSTPPGTPDRKSSTDECLEGDSDEEIDAIAHAPPGPCYAGLMNNVSLPAMQTSLAAWPDGLEDFVSQKHLEKYIQDIASTHGVDEVTQYRTRVEDVVKVGTKWRLLTTTLDESTGQHRLIRRTTFFDAVVVASGHYHMPRIPNIPGLVKLKEKFPDRVRHSKGYRDSTGFKDSNVLLIGAGVSSWDITKEIYAVGGRSYQSSRGGAFDLPASSLPPSGTRVAGVEAFQLHETTTNTPDQHLPVTVKLANDTTLTDIDHVILATGYITSYPFLSNLHSDSKTIHEVDDFILVTEEGSMCHNLYKDIFYIEDPTLSFVGVPYHISTFSLFDIQAEAVARQLAGSAKLPSKAIMRAEYTKRVKEKGIGREFHSLRATGAEIGYAADLVRWANSELRPNVAPMRGHTQTFYAAHRLQREKLAERFGGKLEDWVGLIPSPGEGENP